MAKQGKAKQKQRDKTRSAEDFERIKRTEVVSQDHIATSPLMTPEMADEQTRALLPHMRQRVFKSRDAKARKEADRKRREKREREEATLVIRHA
jgi:hypothetical protein